MLDQRKRKQGNLLDAYCSRLSGLKERENAGAMLDEARRQAEAAAQFATEAMLRAQAANRAKSEFLANMSHELRTPLNAILGFSELIKLEVREGSKKGVEYADHIHQGGTRLLTVLNNVLDLARTEAGRLELQDGMVALESFVQAEVRAAEALAASKKVRLGYEVAEPLLINIDPGKMKQALGNVLSNAIKFTSPGGSVLVRTVRRPSGDLLLSIIDTGIGIPSEHLARVALPFEQMETSYNREHQGTGLGLPIARALIELHGGSLTIESEVEVGTTVHLLVPAKRVSDPPGLRWAADSDRDE